MKCKQGCVHSCICGGKTNVMAGPAVIQAWVLCTTAATSRRQRADHGAFIGLLTAFPRPSVIYQSGVFHYEPFCKGFVITVISVTTGNIQHSISKNALVPVKYQVPEPGILMPAPVKYLAPQL